MLNQKIVKLFWIIILCLNTFNTYAQKASYIGVVQGEVKDNSNSPVEFATVSLFKAKDSSLVTGAISDIEGKFIISKVPFGSYYAEVGFIGFETKTLPSITITKEQPLINLGNISLLSYAKNMDDFNVVEERDLIETKIDKKVYNVSKDVGAQGDNGLEVLKNMPSVDVDDEDKISLRGDESVKILINGRPSAIDPSQLLKQIPASTIEKIEVITNPSAKYNPEGMSGILNIILKKENSSGFNGSFNAGFTYNKKPGYNTSLSVNYKKNKLNVFTNIGYYKGTWGYGGIAHRKYLKNDSTHYQDLSDIGENNHNNIWYSGGADYYINKKNTIYFEASGWLGYGDRFDDNHYDFMDNLKTIQQYSDRYADKTSNYNGNNFNLGWQSEFNKEGHTLDVDFSYSINQDATDDKINDQFFNVSDVAVGIPQKQNTTTTADGNFYFEGKLDYVLPITDSLELEMGVINELEHKGPVFYSESNDTSNILYPDVNLNNDFIYDENVTAFYATLGKQFKKLGVKLGTRIENTILKTELKNTNQKNTQDYLSFFPSIHFSYKIKEGNEYQLSYSKRINRPNTWDVNPFTSYSDPYNLWIGNPALKPENIDVYELSYLRYWDKFNFNSSVYYRQVNDKKTRVTRLNDQGVFSTTPENLATSQVKGGELIIGYRPKKWWRTNTTFNLWTSEVQDNNLNQLTGSTFGWSVQLTSTQTIKKNWTIQIRGKYNGKSESLQGYTLPRYGLNVSVSKKVLKKKGKISLRFRDVFNTRGWHFISNDLGGYSYESDRKWSSQSINISFNYTFGKMNYDTQKRQKKKANSSDSYNSGDSGGDGK